MNKLKIGLVGCGLIGRHQYVPGIKNSKNAELIGVTASSLQNAEKFASEMQIPKTYSNFHHMIADPEIEAVIIATPNHLHYQQVLDAASAGKHILCEKPMALNLSQAKEMVENCKKNSVTFMIAQHLRYKEVNQKVKDILESSQLGKVSTASIQWSFGDGSLQAGTWQSKKELAGGGQIINVNSHCLDLLVYLFGKADKVSAFTSTDNHCEVEDVSVITIEFANGVLATARGSYREAATLNDLEICGNQQSLLIKGACSVSNRGSIIELSTNKETLFNLENSPYTIEVDHFCESVQSKAESVSSGENNLETMWIIMAAYESAVIGKHISKPS